MHLATHRPPTGVTGLVAITGSALPLFPALLFPLITSINTYSKKQLQIKMQFVIHVATVTHINVYAQTSALNFRFVMRSKNLEFSPRPVAGSKGKSPKNYFFYFFFPTLSKTTKLS